MSDANLERITILLQARDRDLSRSLDQMNRRIAGFTRDSTRNTQRMQQQVEGHFQRMSTSALAFGRSLATGLAVGASTAALGFLTTGLRQTVRGLAQVGDEARRAGVGVEVFQEWMYVASQRRIPFDAIVDGFKELSLRADEWIVTGAGPAAEAFERLGFSAEDLQRRLRDPSELMLEIFRRMENLDRAAQIRVFDEVLGGTGGERFVELIAEGETGLRRMMQAARETGAVMSEDLINRADDIDRRFTEIIDTVARLGREAIVGWGIIAEAIGDALTTDVAEQTEADFAEVQRQARDLQQGMENLAATARDLGDDSWGNALELLSDALFTASRAFDDGVIDAQTYQRMLGELAEGADRAVTHISSIDDIQLSAVGRVIDALRGRLANLAEQAAAVVAAAGEAGMTTGTPLSQVIMLQDMLGGRRSQAPQPAPMEGAAAYGSPASGGGSGSGGGGLEGYAAAVEDIQARTRALEMEAAALLDVAGSNMEYGAAIEYARARAQLMNDATEEGRTITPELQAEIDRLAMAYVTAGDSAEEAAVRIRQVQEASERGIDAATDVFMAFGRGADEGRAAVARLILEIARMQAMRGFQSLAGGGGGGFFSFLGGILGGGKRAAGGPVRAGEPYVINENTANSEIMVPSRSGGVLNVAQAKDALRGQGGGGRLSVAIGFDESMNGFRASVMDETGAMIAQGFQQYDKVLPGRVSQIQKNPRRV